MQLHFKIRQQTLICYGCESVVSGSLDYLTCEFQFLDSDWDAVTTKYAVFTLPESTPLMRYVVPFQNDQITQEDHISLSDGTWEVNVVGVNDNGLRITTDSAKILVSPSFTLPLFPTVPQDVGEQLLIRTKKAEAAANDALTTAQKAMNLAPYIGENGNWWVAGEDTGVSATGSGVGNDSIASDEDVDSMLGDIFNSPTPDPDPDPSPDDDPEIDDGDVATDEDVDDMLDDVFGETSGSGDTTIESGDVASDDEVDSMLDDIFG